MKNVLLAFISICILSCSSSNEVVQSGFLQKRKYKKGYHLTKKNTVEKTDRLSSEDLLVDNHSRSKHVSKKGVQTKPPLKTEKVVKNETSEENTLLASIDLKENFKVSALKTAREFVIEDSIQANEVQTIHNSIKQKRKMTLARVSRGIGLGVIPLWVLLIPIPLTYILFLVSLQSLRSYSKNRIVAGGELDPQNQAIEKERLIVGKLFMLHNILLLFGLLCAFVSIVLFESISGPVVLIGVLGVLTLGAFLLVLGYLAIKYFKLFKLIKQEDKIGKKYNVNQE